MSLQTILIEAIEAKEFDADYEYNTLKRFQDSLQANSLILALTGLTIGQILDKSDKRSKPMPLTFSDGMTFDTSGPLRIVQKYDGLYVVGEGIMFPIEDREEGEKVIEAWRPKKQG